MSDSYFGILRVPIPKEGFAEYIQRKCKIDIIKAISKGSN